LVALALFQLIKLGFEHFHRHLTILQLATFGTTYHHDPSREMPHTHGRLHLIHVLPALTTRAHRADFQIGLFNLDVDLIVDIWRYFDGCEARMATRVRIKGADPHESVHSHFGSQKAISIQACDKHRCPSNPRLITWLIVDHFCLETAALSPT